MTPQRRHESRKVFVQLLPRLKLTLRGFTSLCRVFQTRPSTPKVNGWHVRVDLAQASPLAGRGHEVLPLPSREGPAWLLTKAQGDESLRVRR